MLIIGNQLKLKMKNRLADHALLLLAPLLAIASWFIFTSGGDRVDLMGCASMLLIHGK